MIDKDPWALIIIGFVLVLVGFVGPLLMVVRVIQPNLLLSLISHGASVGGLFLGMLGGALYVRRERS